MIPEAGNLSFAVDESQVIVSGQAPLVPGAFELQVKKLVEAFALVAAWSRLSEVLFTLLVYVVFSVLFSIPRFWFRPYLARVTPKPAA